MVQRGVTIPDIEQTLTEGWQAPDARPGTLGKVRIFPYNGEWEGRFHQEKQVTVYDKQTSQSIVILTVMARYGRDFPRGQTDES